MNDRVVFVLFPRSDTRLETLWSTVTGSTGETHALPARTAMSANRAQSPVSLSFRCFFSPWVYHNVTVSQKREHRRLSHENIFFPLFLFFFRYILSFSSMKILIMNFDFCNQEIYCICGKFFFIIYIFA